ncbi:MAG TPA: aldolase/citrate lyase family protein [Arsenicitalea sp.]|nr:aldolase/citrate lyase family protein [Arsenicitalea sp.]
MTAKAHSFEPLLNAPGHEEAALLALSRSAAPHVFIDFEFSVPHDRKEAALTTTITALQSLDWSGKTVSVRVNGLAELSTFHEIGELVAARLPALRAILFPMAETAYDVAAIDRYLTVCEGRAGSTTPLKLEILIETPRALVEIDSIARASSRIDTLHFGAGDFAKGMGISVQPPGTPHPEYGLWDKNQTFHPGDIWHFALMKLSVTARAFGLRAFDGPYVALSDLDGYEQQCRRSRALGLAGKWAITEAQVKAAARLNA